MSGLVRVRCGRAPTRRSFPVSTWIGLSEKDNKGKDTVQVGNRGGSSFCQTRLSALVMEFRIFINIESLNVPMNIHIQSLNVPMNYLSLTFLMQICKSIRN